MAAMAFEDTKINAGEARKEALFQAFAPGPGGGLQAFEDLDAAAAHIRDIGSVLLLYEAPVALVAAAMADPEHADDALRGWAREARGVLALVNDHSERVLLCERSSLFRKPCAAAIAERFNGASAPAFAGSVVQAGSDADAAMAWALLTQHEEVHGLVEALDARAVGNGRKRPGFADLIVRMRRNTFGQADIDTALAAQIAELRGELARIALQAEESEMREAETRERLTITEQDLDEARRQHVILQGSYDELRAQYELVIHSKFWRITAPVRALIRAIRRR